MNKFFLLILLIWIYLSLTQPVLALKRRVRFKAAGITFSGAKLSRPTNSIILTLLNLNRVSKITYTLSYTASGVAEGVVGSITPTGQATDSRDLYFGTCSRGVCTPHNNIANATLVVDTILITGAENRKLYRIKI